MVIPDRNSGEQRKLKIFNSRNSKKSVKESIMVIATREDIDLVDDNFSEAISTEAPRQTSSFSNLIEKLMSIPPKYRTMAMQTYEILSNYSK